jgi:hypothetical protein
MTEMKITLKPRHSDPAKAGEELKDMAGRLRHDRQSGDRR